jgi:hypothetical protein
MFTHFWAWVVTRIERAAAEEPYVLDLTGCLPPVTRADRMTLELMHLGKRQERDGAQP